MRLDREFRAISEANQRSGNRLYIEPYWAAHVHDLSDRMLDRSPDVVHFAGHGEPGGLLFERADGQAQWVPVEHLQRVLGFKRPRCLVLNACYSAERARACAIPYVIAMAGPSHDEGSIEFSRSFYLALARGLDIETSFEHARHALALHGLDDSCQPRLLH
ncbi:MAG: CHAT domain-containing protein [Deltaproteobacteria bacterium]|nr:CHAT domain-containing protein [Deltaproteobacteria bacterium]